MAAADLLAVRFCKHCRAAVGVPREYGARTGMSHLVLAGGIAWLVGTRGIWFVIATVTVFLVGTFFASFIGRRVIPPFLEVRPDADVK